MKNAKDTVLTFLKAVTDQDFDTARQHVTDDLKFIGVMGTRDGADIYFKDMERMKFKYAIKETFIAGDNDVSVWYDIDMGGKTILSSGWYGLRDGKIATINVLFDPRPLL